VKVLDFGIAKLRPADAGLTTGTGTTFGTAYYMSPEQARGAGDIDPRADVWSLGVVLYELLTGRKPFQGEQFLQVIYQILSVEPPPAATVRPGLPARLSEIIERAMTKEADDRLPSVLELAEALLPFAGRSSNAQHVLSAEALAATRATPETRTGEGLRSSGAAAGASTASGRSRAPSVPAVAAATVPVRRRSLPRVVAAVMLAAAVVGGVAYWIARRASATPEHAESAGGVESPTPTPTPTAAVAPVTAPVAVLPPPPPAALVPPPAATVAKRSRIPSEHGSERRIVSVAPPAVAPAPPAVAPAPPPAVPAPAPAPKAGPAGHPLEIEKDNPY